jgi:hypothetical protein
VLIWLALPLCWAPTQHARPAAPAGPAAPRSRGAAAPAAAACLSARRPGWSPPASRPSSGSPPTAPWPAATARGLARSGRSASRPR